MTAPIRLPEYFRLSSEPHTSFPPCVHVVIERISSVSISSEPHTSFPHDAIDQRANDLRFNLI